MDSSAWVPFTISVRTERDVVVLDVSGEFDLSEAESFRCCIQGVIAASDGAVVVDLGEVTFIDSTAISALLAAHRRLAEEGRELRLQHGTWTSRIFELAGLTDFLTDSESTVRQPSVR